MWTALPAHADDTADIKALVKTMTDYVASQKSISFDMETDLEIVTTSGQRLSLESSGAMDVSRPDKVRAERKGGFADVEAVYDGKTLSLLGRNLNLYAQIPLAGDLDHLIDELRDKYGRPLPAADLLKSDSYEQIMSGATDIAYLGPGVILGQMCEHVAMRNDDVDLQLWIAQGDKPYPCRYTITSRTIPGQPQYSVEIWNWKSSAEPGSADFTFTPPAGAQAIEPAKLDNIDELPSHLTPKN
ncbi:hypothetical protein DK847_14610 [Aestuariivirga litoralis]|uniref:DUF2092 domain-containing protein n=2 Tax=Aestuariivirga litoralis TaxID=2650924 RepID=A0A2W2AV06_9HYPH|nr:hypothetical protein DK847_14610 [Aestuariivirga litoralis]